MTIENIAVRLKSRLAMAGVALASCFGCGNSRASSNEIAGHGTGGTPSCTSFDDEEAIGEVVVTFENQRATDVYVAAPCGGPDLFTVTDSADEIVPISIERCGPGACAMFHPVGGCQPICLVGPVVRLVTGGRWTTTWNGLTPEPVTVPSSCVENASGATAEVECSRFMSVREGAYRFAAEAGTSAECAISACACELDDNGACELVGMSSGETVGAEANVSFPTESSILLSFR